MRKIIKIVFEKINFNSLFYYFGTGFHIVMSVFGGVECMATLLSEKVLFYKLQINSVIFKNFQTIQTYYGQSP